MRHRLGWPLRRFGAAIAAVVLLWLCGLGWFVFHGLQADDRSVGTDAIVVLTGGRLRLESGLDLLEAGKARKLFISGVNQHVDREALLRSFGPLADRAACCIVLGHKADNTLGNAQETAGWMRREGYRDLRLVTSWYHMPRARLEFERAMPEISLVAYPVFPARPGGAGLESEAHSALIVVTEYSKYLLALLRPAVARIVPLVPMLHPEKAVSRTASTGDQLSEAAR